MTPEEMIDDILRKEGAFVNDPVDRGGPTNFGITQNVYSKWLGRMATVAQTRNMDEATAREIYELNYYRAPRIDTLPESIQSQILDCAVNHGPKRAIKFVQQICNQAEFGPIAEDGVIGPKTRAVIARAEAEMGPFLTNAIADERLNFYRRIIANDPSQQRFWNGWQQRADSFKVEV
jgi:lysozyme family protein